MLGRFLRSIVPVLATTLGVVAVAVLPPPAANAQTVPPDPWTLRDIDGAIVTLFPGYTDMLRQEQYGYSSANPVVSRITKSGQPVGTVVLPLWGHILTLPSGTSDAWKPTIQNDTGGSGVQNRGSFLRFGAGGQASTLAAAKLHGRLSKHLHQTAVYHRFLDSLSDWRIDRRRWRQPVDPGRQRRERVEHRFFSLETHGRQDLHQRRLRFFVWLVWLDEPNLFSKHADDHSRR